MMSTFSPKWSAAASNRRPMSGTRSTNPKTAIRQKEPAILEKRNLHRLAPPGPNHSHLIKSTFRRRGEHA